MKTIKRSAAVLLGMEPSGRAWDANKINIEMRSVCI